MSAQRTAALTATPGANPWGMNLLWDWVRTDADAVSLTLAGTQTAALSFEAPSLAADAAVAFTVTGTGRGTTASRSRDAEVTIDATASATGGLAIASLPVEGDTYRRDETIELTVTFTERVFVNGTPELGFRIGSGNGGAQQAAAYDRGTGTTELVFVYTVAQADLDNDGVTVDAGGLTLPNGATIRNVDLETAVLGNARIRFLDANVDGRTPAAMGGICDRTRELREALVSRASGISSCADMDAAALAALPASLDLSNQGIAALKPGDFAGLGHVTLLDLNDNELTDIAPGVLDPLTALSALDLENNAIARIPAGALDPLTELTSLDLAENAIATLFPGTFDRLTKLGYLHLNNNQLTALPDGIFEPLVNADVITLGRNPGSADWVPSAVAEVEGGITELWEGREITLDGSASASGPWGSNLEYAWSASRSLPVEYGDASAARTTATLTDTGGAGGPFHYTLSVSGRGGPDIATATLPLTVVSQPTITGVAFTSTPRAGSASFTNYRLGEPVEVTVTFSAPVTVTGVPYLQILLLDDDDTIDDLRRADYVRTVDGNRLVFAYEVQAADASGEDITVCGTGDHASCESRLHLPAGAAIHAGDGVVPARLGFAGLEPGSHTYGAEGATAAPTGGICERTPQIRDEIVSVLVDYGWTGVSDCGDVTPEVLYGACEEVTFDFSDKGITALKAGDFEGFTSSDCSVDLSGNALTSISADVLPASVYQIDLSDNDLTHIPAGIFPQIVELEYIYLGGNRIETIAPDAFAGMSGLRLLRLRDNRLSTLPDGVFEDLTGASTIDLAGNPGSAGFKPVVDIDQTTDDEFFAMEPVTLTASVTGPWGSNVSHAWSQAAGTAQGTFADANAATPVFTMPVFGSTTLIRIELTVTGKGGSGHSASALAELDVNARPRARSGEVTSRPRTTTGSNANTYGKDERIEITLTYSEPVVVRRALCRTRCLKVHRTHGRWMPKAALRPEAIEQGGRRVPAPSDFVSVQPRIGLPPYWRTGEF